MQTKIRIEMSPQLKRNLSAEYTIGIPLKGYIQEATELVRDEGRKEAPTDLGKMRDSHVAIVDPAPIPQWGRMEVQAVSSKNAPYPIFVHEGTKPHFPPIEAIRGWAERHGIPPFALAMSIARKGTKANPWLERTVKKVLPKLTDTSKLAANIKTNWDKT